MTQYTITEEKNGKWYRTYLWHGKMQEEECTEHAFAWSGRVPCTGVKICIHCGKVEEVRGDIRPTAKPFNETNPDNYSGIWMVLGHKEYIDKLRKERKKMLCIVCHSTKNVRVIQFQAGSEGKDCPIGVQVCKNCQDNVSTGELRLAIIHTLTGFGKPYLHG